MLLLLPLSYLSRIPLLKFSQVVAELSVRGQRLVTKEAEATQGEVICLCQEVFVWSVTVCLGYG